MQNNSLEEQISIIREKIRAKHGGEPLENWRYSQYKELSKEIAKISGISISHTTLIRLLKSSSTQSIPQLSTLRALVIYLGYASLEEFVAESIPNQSSIPTSVEVPESPKKLPRELWIVVAVLGLVIFTAYLLSSIFRPSQPVSLKLIHPTSGYSDVLTFKYLVPTGGYYFRLTPQSFTPYRANKPHVKEMPLNPEDSIINLRIKIPCHFVVSIIKGRNTLYEKKGSMLTYEWLNILQSKERRVSQSSRFKELVTLPTFSEGNISCNQEVLDFIEENTLDRLFEVNYVLIDSFGIDPNNIVFETRLRNISKPGFLDEQLSRVTLLTTSGLVEVPLVSSNNFYRAKVWVSDQILSYKNQFMYHHAFPEKVGKWITLKLELSDKQCRINIDGKRVETVPYQRPLGTLTGIRYKFINNGQVDYCRITGPSGKVLFEDNFDDEALVSDLK